MYLEAHIATRERMEQIRRRIDLTAETDQWLTHQTSQNYSERDITNLYRRPLTPRQ